MSSVAAVVLDHVSVAYGKNAALRDVSAAFPKGAVGLLGPNGAGKSTLLNALVPGAGLLSGQVNPVTGKGRHTTSAAWLIVPEPGFELIDTPGVRAFGLWGIGPRDLDQAWPEFRRHLGQCRFADCRHDSEPGCAIRAAADGGEVSPRRWESFRKLRAELEGEEVRR